MAKSPHGAELVRLIFLIGFIVLAFMAGRASCPASAPVEKVDYTTLAPSELSWVQEGIQERISELTDKLIFVQNLLNEKS